MSPSNDDYLASGKAARLLHMSPRTVLRWQREGLISNVISELPRADGTGLIGSPEARVDED